MVIIQRDQELDILYTLKQVYQQNSMIQLVLISPDVVVANDDQCFRFYYHMFGSNIYRLNIYARISKLR